MKQILVPIALAAGLVGAAQAQMTIYGLLDASYGKSLLSEVFLREKADLHSGGDNGSSEGNSTSRVGIKGSAPEFDTFRPISPFQRVTRSMKSMT